MYYVLLIILITLSLLVTLPYIIITNIKKAKYKSFDKSLFRNTPSEINIEPIPKVLYKICLKPGKRNEKLDTLFDKLQKQNPEYKIVLFDDADCVKFIKEHFDEDVYYAYKNLIPPTYKCDLMRYCILYINGGIYGDLFQDYYLPLDELVDVKRDKLVLVQDYYNFKDKQNGIYVCFLAALPKQQIFLDCINEIINNVKNKNYTLSDLSVTGPGLFAKIFYEKYTDYDYTMKLAIDKNATHISNYHDNKQLIELKSDGCKQTVNRKLVYGKLWKKRKIYLNELL